MLNVGGPGYTIPPHVKTTLDQLKALAEELGVQEAMAEEASSGPPAEDNADAQGRSDKPQKKLPTQLNPLLAKLARHAATENDKVPGECRSHMQLTHAAKVTGSWVCSTGAACMV